MARGRSRPSAPLLSPPRLVALAGRLDWVPGRIRMLAMLGVTRARPPQPWVARTPTRPRTQHASHGWCDRGREQAASVRCFTRSGVAGGLQQNGRGSRSFPKYPRTGAM